MVSPRLGVGYEIEINLLDFDACGLLCSAVAVCWRGFSSRQLKTCFSVTVDDCVLLVATGLRGHLEVYHSYFVYMVWNACGGPHCLTNF